MTWNLDSEANLGPAMHCGFVKSLAHQALVTLPRQGLSVLASCPPTSALIMPVQKILCNKVGPGGGADSARQVSQGDGQLCARSRVCTVQSFWCYSIRHKRHQRARPHTATTTLGGTMTTNSSVAPSPRWFPAVAWKEYSSLPPRNMQCCFLSKHMAC